MWHWNKSKKTDTQKSQTVPPQPAPRHRFGPRQPSPPNSPRDLQANLDRGIDAGFVYYEER